MRISRNLKKSTMRQRVCELLYTSAVQVYNHGRLSWREITYLVSSFFLFSLSLFTPLRGQLILIIFIRARFRRIYRRYDERRERKKKFLGCYWDEMRRKKRGKRMEEGERETRGFIICLPVSQHFHCFFSGTCCVWHTGIRSTTTFLFLSLSLKFFLFFFIFEQLSLRVPPFLSNRFLSAFFFFFSRIVTMLTMKRKRNQISLSLSLSNANIKHEAFDNANFIWSADGQRALNEIASRLMNHRETLSNAIFWKRNEIVEHR